VLRRIFGSKREEVAGGWRRLKSDQIMEDDMGGVCSTHGRDENSYKILVRKGRDQLEDLDVDGRIIFNGT